MWPVLDGGHALLAFKTQADANLGTTGWQLRDGSSLIALYDTQADAQAAVVVMQHASSICYVGRDYGGSDRLQYITTYFA